MVVHKSQEIFDYLYNHIDGKAISNTARAKRSSWYMGHTYGEVTYHGFLRMLAMMKLNKGDVFYDLGSGTGKAVILAALLVPFSKIVGIEILKELYDTSCTVFSFYRQLTSQNNTTHPFVSFMHGDFKKADISDANIIFMNATCMHYEFEIPFIRKLEQLKKGTKIITNTITIPTEKYSIHKIGLVPFTWGEEEVFIHEKR